MITKDEYGTITELEGKFKINKKYCFCCNKLVDIYLSLERDKLIFFNDKSKTKIYKIIYRTLVLGINRRIRKEKDKNKLSIYYLEDENSNIIKELKLKTENRYDMEAWISILNKKIKPKRWDFNVVNKNYVKSNEIFNFKNQKNFYISLCNLEYILLKNKMLMFFEIYRKRESNVKINDNSDENDLINNF